MKAYKYLDPKALMRLKRMDLVARLAVEGFISGLHKSPHRGFSIEFAEHREYTPGCDPKHIDWRVYGRMDKWYIKQYEEETNLRAFIVLDTSASMDYASDGLTKFEYGAYLAASLTYLMISQQDSVGLVACSDQVVQRIPPRSNPGHLRAVCAVLEDLKAERTTELVSVLDEIAANLKRRSLVIVISDLFDDEEAVVRSLKHLRHRRNEVIVFHVLDPTELEFPFEDYTVFEDMEIPDEVQTDPQLLRDAYLDEFFRFVRTIQRGCREAGIDYCQANTAEPFDQCLGAYLAKRGAMRTRVR